MGLQLSSSTPPTMSGSAAHIAREAKGLHQGLKELLKTHHPWDKEIEFSRKNLRRQYLRLLLLEPYASESRDAETHLWMQTSYQFISHYKQSLAALDRTLQSAPRHQPRQPHGPVEYRKLMQRFRQFLADEDKFWSQFVLRYQRSFGLHEARPVLLALGITSDDPSTASDTGDRDKSSNRTNRHLLVFPPEDSFPAPDPAEHHSRLAILSKAIVCLGDIARYRELYNEAGGRPKAGQEDGKAPAKRAGRGSRGSIPGFDAIPRARNYDKAIQCYEQARLLVPYEGNSSHQLAILAFYQGDMFSSLFHYYRALCVRQPYDTASENVKKILNKALDQHASKSMDQSTMPESGQVPPRLRVEYLKENIVLLHALWRLGSDKLKMNVVTHADDVAKDFNNLVSERVLPIETVSKVVVLTQGALWKHRMIRDTSPPSNRRSSGLPDSSVVESQILTHVIAIHRVLLEIGAAELTVPPEDAAENDLAQRITAPFRRTLPALRIASKWLLANIDYVSHTARSPQPNQTGQGTRSLVEGLSLFWAKFTQFYKALSAIFPLARLPPLTTPLDEDIDLKGFLPLRDLLVDGGTLTEAVPENEAEAPQNGTPHGREKVHPNEEQLMRIWDLLKDAKSLSQLESCPVHVDGNGFFLDNSAISSTKDLSDQISPICSCSVSDDDAIADTRTDDDLVDAAFRKGVLDTDDAIVDDEEDGEVILWDPRVVGSPLSHVPAPLPTTPILKSPGIKEDVVRGAGAARPPVVAGTTALDLLNNVMGKPMRPVRPASSSTVQPQFPFGLGPNAPPSIWSTSLDQSAQQRVQVHRYSPSTWSPPFESTQRRAVASPPLSAGLGHRQALSMSSVVPQQSQPPFPAPAGSSYGVTLSADRQPAWSNMTTASFVDPAIVSAAGRPMMTGGGLSDVHGQGYVASGIASHKSPFAARIRGI